MLDISKQEFRELLERKLDKFEDDLYEFSMFGTGRPVDDMAEEMWKEMNG